MTCCTIGLRLGFFVILVCLCLVSNPVHGDIPKVISYQGRVTDTGGVPVSDGAYNMRFRLFDAPTGGTAIWGSTTHLVDVAGGVFSVLLGEAPMPPLEVAFDEDLWLVVTFDGVDQLPRHRISSAGYTYMASGLIPGTEIYGNVGDGYVSSLVAINQATAPDASGLYAYANGGAGYTHGVYATNNSPDGDGIFARATDASGATRGLYAQVLSGQGTGVLGQATATTGYTVGVRGEVHSTEGIGVQGFALATTGYALGIWGDTASPSGDGVRGRSTSPTGSCWGVYGLSESDEGRGVVGWASASTGETYGVAGESSSPDGRGVWGLAASTSGWTYGVYGQTSSAIGDGVHGTADATAGGAYGGYFETASSGGIGAYGRATSSSGDTYGLYGYSSSSSGTGVYGLTTPTSGYALGVSGETFSSHGIGVIGLSSASPGSTGTGVHGRTYSYFGYGVSGVNSNFTGSGGGVSGGCASPGGRGVDGYSGSSTGTAYGVYGTAGNPSGSSRVGVYYSGGLAGTGTKSCVVKTSKGPTMYYCQESPECWFEDFGDGELISGRSHIELDPVFLETVTINNEHPMRVFVELGGDCKGVFVERRRTGFDVVELQRGRSTVPFTYRVVAKRRDFETERLRVCEAARSDPYLYPEFRDKLMNKFLDGNARMEEYRRLTEERRLSLKQGAKPAGDRIRDLRPDKSVR